LGLLRSRHEAELPPSLKPTSRLRSAIFYPLVRLHFVALKENQNVLSECFITQLILKIRTQAGNQIFSDSLLCEKVCFHPTRPQWLFLIPTYWTALTFSCLATTTSPSKVFSGMQDPKAQHIKVMSCCYDTLFQSRSLLTVVCDKMKKSFQK
jgi:hypothetical protein